MTDTATEERPKTAREIRRAKGSRLSRKFARKTKMLRGIGRRRSKSNVQQGARKK
jgi:hypothetical protein